MTKAKNKTKKSEKKVVVVNRKFILDLANNIYDPKTRRFLRLCNGTLQNGPDPTDPQRPMHCGLGELYFAMTGRQPHDDDVSERQVTELAVELSTIDDFYEREAKSVCDNARAEEKRARAQVTKFTQNENLRAHLLEAASNFADEQESYAFSDKHDKIETVTEMFRSVLARIPEQNDDEHEDVCQLSDDENEDNEDTSCSRGGCTYEQYRARSCRVARQLREAAKHLPE